MSHHMMRRVAIGLLVGAMLGCAGHQTQGADDAGQPAVRFGISTDLHIGKAIGGEAKLRAYVEAMKQWNPDFLVDLGDLATPSVYGRPRTWPEAHDDQLERLRQCWATIREVPCPVYPTLGNHCVGWIRGGDEQLRGEDLQPGQHPGEDITKQEWLSVTGMSGRYYSFDHGGYHFIVLDANNTVTPEDLTPEQAAAIPPERLDDVYCIDAAQLAWLADDLESHRAAPKIIFCHQELVGTPKLPPPGSDEPLSARPGKPRGDIVNAEQVCRLFRDDGNVLASLHGHKHSSGWTKRDGTYYITLGELGSVRSRTGDGPTYSKATLSGNTLDIEGVGKQRSYRFTFD